MIWRCRWCANDMLILVRRQRPPNNLEALGMPTKGRPSWKVLLVLRYKQTIHIIVMAGLDPIKSGHDEWLALCTNCLRQSTSSCGRVRPPEQLGVISTLHNR